MVVPLTKKNVSFFEIELTSHQSPNHTHQVESRHDLLPVQEIYNVPMKNHQEFHMTYTSNTYKIKLKNWYNYYCETCLIQTLNKSESCINRTQKLVLRRFALPRFHCIAKHVLMSQHLHCNYHFIPYGIKKA